MKKNKLPKYQTGGPIDPNLNNRLMQYLFGRNTNKSSILDVRSPNEYGVSLGDRFNIQSGLSFDPMTGMPTGYGKVGINNKGFNLGLEKRKGQSTFNVGYNNPNFNIDATYSNTNKMPSVGGNVGFNTKGFNVGVGGNYSPDYKNISANIGYNNKGFNAGLNYDYSGQSSLSGNVGYGNNLFNVGLSGNYAPGDANINLNTTYNLGKRKKQKAEPIPLAFNTPEEIQLIREDAVIDSNEAAGPPKKSYGGKITNMKKKKSNNLPQMFWGGKLAPQLFDLSTNALTNLTTYAVTDMIKAIREPEQEMRPTKMNTGFTMANGGMIKRADGSYSKRGLWDNIRANKGSGKKPTKQMLEQERKIKAKSKKANGGIIEPIDPVDKDAAINEMNRNITSILSGKPLKTGLTMTKLNPNEEATYQEWVKSLTPNLQGGADDKYYDMRGAWQVGEQPELFYNDEQGNFQSAHPIDVKQQGSIYEPHLFSRNPFTGKSLKSPYHTSFQHALEGDIKSGGTPYMNLKTGDFYTYGTGGTIHIKPSKRGTFTAAAKKHGKSVQAFASQVLANKDNYSPAMVKKANFARNASKWKHAFGGMITPDMYMQQMMYGSYAQGGQVPQNIPVEVEGGEAYELPNGQMGEFEGPSHANGGIPVALPEQTKVYSKQLKVNGKTMADRKTKREANVAKLEKILSKNPSDKFVREALKRQQETAALEEQQDMAMQEQANQQQQMQEQTQQGMMQEQAMAGLMQDPAMMQQMGMMMYGGKLDNGTPPYGVSNVLPMINNMVKQYNEQINPPYKNTIPYGEGSIYSNFGSYPDVYYRKFVGGGYKDGDINFSYFNPKGKQTTWTDIPISHPAYNQLLNGLEYTNKHYKAGMFPSKGIIDGGLFRQPYTSTNPEVGSTSEANYDIMGVQPELDVKKKFPQADLNSQREAYLKAEEEKAKSQPKVVASAITTKPNPKPLFDEEQLNMLANPISSYNPLDLRENVGVDITKKPTPDGAYDAMSNILGQTFENIALSKDPYINTKGGMIPNPLYNEVIGNKMLREEDPKKPNKFMNFLNKAADETGDFFTGLFDRKGKPKKEKGTKKDEKGLPLTAGDRMGMAGTLFGGLAPMTTTMLNRMMTPKNQNFFREYGAEGLRAMQEAQALSAINRDKQLADIKLGEEASRQRGRNSARGVNTLRAMDIASDITANQAQNQAYNMYAQQMMQLLGQKAQMENMQDQAVMQGEYTRDLADRQDVDQFYTNLAENFASQSELMQKQGRDMNQAQYNKMILQMSPMFSKYGIGMDMRNGEYVMTYNGETIDQTKARLIVEKGIEAEKKAALEKAGTTTGTVTPNTPVAPVNSNTISAINPLGLGHTAYFNPIFTDINIPTVTDKSLIKSATKRR